MAENNSEVNDAYDVPAGAIREDNAIDKLTTPFIKQDEKLYSPRRRQPPISAVHLKGHPSYKKVAKKQLERKKTWVALNLIPSAPASLKQKLRLVGDIAGGVAIQPTADKVLRAEREADSEHVTETEQNENESQWSDLLNEADEKKRKGYGFNGMIAKSKAYGNPTTKDRLVNRRFLEQTGEYEGETDREFCKGSVLLDYDTIQKQYWIDEPYNVRPSSVQQKSKTDVEKLLKIDTKSPNAKKRDEHDQFLQKRLSYQHIEQESRATSLRSKQKTARLPIPQKYQRRLTLFKYEQEWQKDTLSQLDSPKMLGSYLNQQDSARKQTRFILQSQRYLQTYIQGQAIDKIETPSLGVNSDDYRKQEELKRMDLDSEPINLRYGQLLGTDISNYNKLRQATAQSYSKLADDSSHRTGHSTDYLYGINVNHEYLRDFLTDRVEGGLLNQLDLNSEKNYIKVHQNVDPYSLKAWMHKQAVSLKNLRARKRLIHEDGTVEPIYVHSERDWRCDRYKLDLFEASLIDDAIDKQKQAKKSQSHRIKNKAAKITYKNIYLDQDFTLKKDKKLHASYKNNMLGDLIHDLDEYTKKLKEEGYIMRRVPSIDIDPVDRQRQERAKTRQARVFKILADYYDRIENNPANIRTRNLKRGKFQIEERRRLESRSPEQIAQEEKKKFRQRRFQARNTKQSRQPRIDELRNTGFNIDVAKSMVIGSNAIDDSVNMVRKNIFYISRMKLKNQFQNDLITYKVQQEIQKRKENAHGPAIIPDPDYQQPPGSKVSKKKELKDLKKKIRRYIAMSPNLYNDPKHPRDAYSIQNNFMQNPLKTHHFSSKQKQISSNTFNLSSVQVRGQKRPSKPASGSMSKVLSRKEIAVSDTQSKQLSKSPGSPEALIKPIMLDPPGAAQNANSQDKLCPGTPALLPAGSPDLPKENAPKGPGLRSSSTAPAGQAPRVGPGSKGGLLKPPSQKYGSKGRLRINQDLVHASIKMQQQELKNSMMAVPDPTSSPMGALFRQSYQESYANPMIRSRKAKVQQEISQKFKYRELYLPVKDTQSRMKRIEERVKNVSIKMLNDRSMSTNIHSKYWSDARQSKTYASPAPVPVNNSLLQFKALIEEPSSAYFEKQTPNISNQLDSRAQMIMSQTLVSPNQLNSTQSRSFFSPSGGNNDDSRIFNLHDNQRAKNSIISSIKRDCNNFRNSQPVNASLDHHHLHNYTRANIMSSVTRGAQSSNRQYSNLQEKTNYGQILGRKFKFKTLEKMGSKKHACIGASIANRSKVSQTQLKSSLQVQNMNRRFLNQRFQPYTLEQQNSFTTNNDIGDFVNLGDVVVNAPGDHQAGEDNEDTYFLSPDEVNQFIPPPERMQAGGNTFDTINVDNAEHDEIENLNIRADSINSNKFAPMQQGYNFQQLQSVTQNSGGSRNQGYQTIEHLHQPQSRYGKQKGYPSQKQYKTIDPSNFDPLSQYDDAPGEQQAGTGKSSMIGSRLIMAANQAPYSSLVPYPVTEVAVKYPSIPNLQSQASTGKPRRLTATNHAPRAYTGNPSRRSSLICQSTLMPQTNQNPNQGSNPYVQFQPRSALANAGGDTVTKLKLFGARQSKQ